MLLVVPVGASAMAAAVVAHVVYGCPRHASRLLVGRFGCHAVRCGCVNDQAASSCTIRVEYSGLFVVVLLAMVGFCSRLCVVASASFVGATATGVVADHTAFVVSHCRVKCLRHRARPCCCRCCRGRCRGRRGFRQRLHRRRCGCRCHLLCGRCGLRLAAYCRLPALLLQLQRLPLPKLQQLLELLWWRLLPLLRQRWRRQLQLWRLFATGCLRLRQWPRQQQRRQQRQQRQRRQLRLQRQLEPGHCAFFCSCQAMSVAASAMAVAASAVAAVIMAMAAGMCMNCPKNNVNANCSRDLVELHTQRAHGCAFLVTLCTDCTRSAYHFSTIVRWLISVGGLGLAAVVVVVVPLIPNPPLCVRGKDAHAARLPTRRATAASCQ